MGGVWEEWGRKVRFGTNGENKERKAKKKKINKCLLTMLLFTCVCIGELEIYFSDISKFMKTGGSFSIFKCKE